MFGASDYEDDPNDVPKRIIDFFAEPWKYTAEWELYQASDYWKLVPVSKGALIHQWVMGGDEKVPLCTGCMTSINVGIDKWELLLKGPWAAGSPIIICTSCAQALEEE
jgi:hypothetical protein